MSELVSVSMQDDDRRKSLRDIAVVTVDSPPVNTLTREVRAGLKAAFESLRGNPAVKGVVLACAGKTFLSGGDMREFETGILGPGYHEVLRLIEDSAVPVVAALHGTVMGGGVETAIACHYRVALDGTRLGLPEITLGIIPGAGGTQRMPRLIGLEPALDMMLSGKPLSAAQAKDLGLVDAVVADDVTGAAVAYARELVAAGGGPRRTRERSVAGAEKAAEILATRRAQAAKTMRNRTSPSACASPTPASPSPSSTPGRQRSTAGSPPSARTTSAR